MCRNVLGLPKLENNGESIFMYVCETKVYAYKTRNPSFNFKILFIPFEATLSRDYT